MLTSKFCVIGKSCGYHTARVNRKWFDTQAEAEEHAQDLIRRNARQNDGEATPAFVVEVKSVIELEQKPINVRRARAGDFE